MVHMYDDKISGFHQAELNTNLHYSSHEKAADYKDTHNTYVTMLGTGERAMAYRVFSNNTNGVFLPASHDNFQTVFGEGFNVPVSDEARKELLSIKALAESIQVRPHSLNINENQTVITPERSIQKDAATGRLYANLLDGTSLELVAQETGSPKLFRDLSTLYVQTTDGNLLPLGQDTAAAIMGGLSDFEGTNLSEIYSLDMFRQFADPERMQQYTPNKSIESEMATPKAAQQPLQEDKAIPINLAAMGQALGTAFKPLLAMPAVNSAVNTLTQAVDALTPDAALATDTPPAAEMAPSAEANSPVGNSYTIQPGDSLSKILAEQYKEAGIPNNGIGYVMLREAIEKANEGLDGKVTNQDLTLALAAGTSIQLPSADALKDAMATSKMSYENLQQEIAAAYKQPNVQITSADRLKDQGISLA